MKPWIKWTLVALMFLLALGVWGYFYKIKGMREASFWESAIQKYEAADKKKPPPHGGIAFVGSSSIVYWKTIQRDLAPLPVIGRGFGGSHLDHATHYAPRIIAPYKPKIVVLYSGENDLARDESVEQVLNDLRGYFRWHDAALPKARLFFLSVKPSPLRWRYWPKFQAFNRKAKALCQKRAHTTFVDVSSALLKGGKPDKSLFLWDRLHMNPKGYQKWTAILKPLLDKASKPSPRK